MSRHVRYALPRPSPRRNAHRTEPVNPPQHDEHTHHRTRSRKPTAHEPRPRTFRHLPRDLTSIRTPPHPPRSRSQRRLIRRRLRPMPGRPNPTFRHHRHCSHPHQPHQSNNPQSRRPPIPPKQHQSPQHRNHKSPPDPCEMPQDSPNTHHEWHGQLSHDGPIRGARRGGSTLDTAPESGENPADVLMPDTRFPPPRLLTARSTQARWMWGLLNLLDLRR